jgi:predicted metal-dependent hydrolase
MDPSQEGAKALQVPGLALAAPPPCAISNSVRAIPESHGSFPVTPDSAPVLEIDGRSIALAVRRSHRARRLYLRVDPAASPDLPVELILPRGVALAEGLRFARDKSGWVARRLAALPEPVVFADGGRVEVCGEALIIRHVGGTSRTHRVGDELHVAGTREHVARRVRDWIRTEARRVLTARTHATAARIGKTVRGIRLGDPRSRWGSCSPDGRLAFSWRLILAPPFVLDYVVAHEVAHLVHLNHGRRFWQLATTLAGDIEAPRRWLNRFGSRLLRHG